VTATPTMTPTLTPTNPNAPNCSGGGPGGVLPLVGMNIGSGDGDCYNLWDGHTIDLSPGTFTADGNPDPTDYELVYYEKPSDNPYTVMAMDLVVIWVHVAENGNWYQVFYWGNPVANQNSSIDGYGPGVDNQLIPKSVLIGPPVAQTGVQIDVDSPLTGLVTFPVTIDQIRITAPPGGAGDGCDIDAVDIIP